MIKGDRVSLIYYSPGGGEHIEGQVIAKEDGLVRVQWDKRPEEPQATTWEEGKELRVLGRKPPSFFEGTNPTLAFRESQRQASEVRIWVAEKYHGLKVRKRLSPSRDRQKTLDIYSKILGGTPVKGGGGSKASKGRLKLARVLASPEPILVAQGPLLHNTVIEKTKTRLGWRARLLYLSKRPPTKRKMIRRHSRW